MIADNPLNNIFNFSLTSNEIKFVNLLLSKGRNITERQLENLGFYEDSIDFRFPIFFREDLNDDIYADYCCEFQLELKKDCCGDEHYEVNVCVFDAKTGGKNLFIEQISRKKLKKENKFLLGDFEVIVNCQPDKEPYVI